MGPFAPGAWAGVNDGFLIARQREQEQMRLAQGRQQMEHDAYSMQTAREDRSRQTQGRVNAGQALYGMSPPPMQARQPQPQAMPPGQPSVPMQPPQSPQPPGPPRMQQTGGMPGPGMPRQDPQMEAVNRLKLDLVAVDRELARPGITPDIKAILIGDRAKTQDQLAQLTGQPAPYRPMPAGGNADGPPPLQQPQQQNMAPPPVSPAPQSQQGGMLMQIIQRAQAQGIPADQLTDMVDSMGPALKMQLQEETMQLRGTVAENNMQIKAIMAGLAASKEARQSDQGQQRIDQGAQRLEVAKERARQGATPTASELADPQTARIFYDIFKVSGKPPPFAWGKAGEGDRTAWMRAVKQFSQDDGQTGGDVAGGQADGKANASALTQNTKDLAAIRPYKVMLDKNANVAIDLGRKVKLANSQWANQPIQWLQKNGGSNPDLREYLAQITIVQTEAARVLNNPRLVGQLTDSARHEMQDIIKGTMPLADTERVLKRMMADGENRVKALEDENGSLKKGASGKSGASSAPAASQDSEAVAWAKANPQDPRAAQIMKLQGK